MPRSFRKVLCALDLGPNTKLTIDMGRQIAEQNGATLVLFHVTSSGTTHDAEKRVRLAGGNLSDSCEIQVVTGDPAVEILKAAERNQADLIVMATHGRTGLDHLILGSVAERVVRESPVPVLTVRGSSGKRAHIPESVLL